MSYVFNSGSRACKGEELKGDLIMVSYSKSLLKVFFKGSVKSTVTKYKISVMITMGNHHQSR
jgi:hypothetical protein